MKKYLYILLTLSTIGRANIKEMFVRFGIPVEEKKIITVINGFDCLNCYKGLAIFLDGLKTKKFENNYAVIGGITEREVQHFIKNTLQTEYVFKKVIVSDEFFAQLNSSGISRVICFDGAKKIYDAPSKELSTFKYELLQKDVLPEISDAPDSIDVTKYMRTSAIEVSSLTAGRVLLTDKRDGNMVIVNVESKTVSDSLNLVSYYNSTLDKKLWLILRDSAAVRFNLDIIKSPKNIDKSSVNIVSVETAGDKIFVGTRVLIREDHQGKGFMMKYKLLVTEFNDRLNFVADYLLPQKLSADSNSYIDVLFMRMFNSSGLFAHITSGKRENDSLLCKYSLVKNKMAIEEKVYGCIFPKALPKMGKNKLPIFYKVNLVLNDDDTLYYYNRGHALYHLNTNLEIGLRDIEQQQRRDPDVYIQQIMAYSGKNLVFTSNGRSAMYSLVYDHDFKKLMSKRKLSVGVLSQVVLANDKLVGLKIGSNTTVLYLHSMKQ